MELEEIFRRFNLFESAEFGVGASWDEIVAAQKKLGTNLPLSYIAFLKELGWGGVGSWEIYGLGKDTSLRVDLVDNTLIERHEAEPHLPLHLIPLMNDGFGNHYCLDVKQLEAGECPVVFWNHELGRDQTPEQIAESFKKWLLELLNESYEKEGT